jgi:hypothetical protein
MTSTFHRYCYSDDTENDYMGRACSMRGKWDKHAKRYLEDMKVWGHIGNVAVDGNLI